jgi:hypothetical protein
MKFIFSLGVISLQIKAAENMGREAGEGVRWGEGEGGGGGGGGGGSDGSASQRRITQRKLQVTSRLLKVAYQKVNSMFR